MTPSEREAQSNKYLPSWFVFVPTEDGMAVFRNFGGDRPLEAIFATPQELWDFLTQDFADAKTRTTNVRAQEAFRRKYKPQPALPDLVIDMDGLDLDFEL